VYSGPAAYLRFFPPQRDDRSPVLDEPERPTVHAPNYNHWVMIPVMAQRRDDAFVYLAERPLDYFRTAWQGMLQVLGPTTEWHPRHGKPGSAHFDHERLLGPYASVYNGILHAGPGIYALLPLPLAWGVGTVLARARTRVRYRSARTALLAFALVQIDYVLTTSSLFTIGESARYRHEVEALIWLVVAMAVVAAVRRHRRRRMAR
jgi:hypothetical protein